MSFSRSLFSANPRSRLIQVFARLAPLSTVAALLAVESLLWSIKVRLVPGSMKQSLTRVAQSLVMMVVDKAIIFPKYISSKVFTVVTYI